MKNLRLENVNFTRRTLVHGPNNSGKTNLLLLLQLAFKSKEKLDYREQPKFIIEGYESTTGMLTRKGLHEVSTGSVTLRLDCFSTQFSAARKSLLGAESNTQAVEISFTFTSEPPGTYTTIDLIKIGAKVAHSSTKPAKEPLLEELTAWIAAELANSVVYIPNNRIHHGRPVPLNLDGALNPIEDLANAAFRFKNDPFKDPEISTQLASRLKEFFGIQDFRSELTITPVDDRADKSDASPRVGIGLRSETSEWFAMSQVGTGVQQVFAILSQILVHPNASVALIEEFETSLSNPNKNRMLELFMQLTSDKDRQLRQIIATSHSTFRPSFPEYSSLGAERSTDPKLIEFRTWEDADWKKFSS